MTHLRNNCIILLVMLLLFTGSGLADDKAGEEINWQVISSGGTEGASTNFSLKGTLGQTAVGYGSSTSYGLSHGFWQEFGGGTCCNHDGIRGDVDGSGGSPNVGDLSYLVSRLFDQPPGPAPPCFEEGDIDASSSINVGDLAYLVAYLFDQPSGPAPAACP